MNLKLKELKIKSPQELLAYAEELGVENASSMRTQDMLFSGSMNINNEMMNMNNDLTMLIIDFFEILRMILYGKS